MSRRLRRGRRSVFRKKATWVKPLVWVVVLVLLAVVGYFLTDYVWNRQPRDDVSSSPSAPVTESSQGSIPDTDPVTQPPATEETTLVDITQPVRAV